MAISLTEAWSNVLEEQESYESQDPAPVATAPRVLSAPSSDGVDAPRRKHAKYKSKFEDNQLSALVAELKALRKDQTRQQAMNMTVVYGAAAISVVLLVIVLHTQNRIHYTTESLLLNMKRT